MNYGIIKTRGDRMKTIMIIGAGASGLACASALVQQDVHKEMNIMIVEQFPKVARKLLATGNGRCNLSNKNIAIESYNTNHPMIETILSSFQAPAYFSSLGLLTKYEGNLLYPFSNQAASVKQVLLDAICPHVTMITNCKVLGIEKRQDDYHIHTNQEDYIVDYVVCALGSPAYHLSGEDNVHILETLGIITVPFVPSLVAVHTQPVYPDMKGVRVKAKVTLYHKGQRIDTKEGEVLFTETGLSGICIMQISRWLLQFPNAAFIELDLFSQYTTKEYKQWMQTRKQQFGSEYLEGIFPQKMAQVMRQNKLHPKRMRFKVVKTNDETKAQVMHGGVSLQEVTDTLESTRYANLYVTGEALDVDGDCGGFNLHFAFASGIWVAKAIKTKENKYVTNR